MKQLGLPATGRQGPDCAGAAAGGASRGPMAMRRGRGMGLVQGRTWNSGERCVLPIPMEMARRRYIALLALSLLGLPASAANAELGITSLPGDLSPSLAVQTVSGLATAPVISALPVVKR